MKTIFAVLFLLSSFVQAQDSLRVSIGRVGSPNDTLTKTQPGFVLAGGGKDVDAAMKWLLERSGGGDVVIIRASGSTGYNDYLFELGKVNSVETLLIDSREKAARPETAEKIRNAEALFIAGGDQWNYVKYWKDTEVSKAISYLIEEKKAPVGGTSAGCAVLSEFIFDAQFDTVLSPDALANPYTQAVSISKSFISIPVLKNTIADQHYSQRKRQGRHVTFMARIMQDFKIDNPKGIAADERTAVCIDAEGDAFVFGSGKAFFLTANKKPEQCSPDKPLTWNQKGMAVAVWSYQATEQGTRAFNLNRWPTQPQEYWSAREGNLVQAENH
ncbi:MAG: cyanophycinase [Cyclobacteriaceae bacterium]|nr:cyanophycinase [Cyclobacteriaceae bacterium]